MPAVSPEEVPQVVQPMPSAVRWVVVDARAMTHVDYSAGAVWSSG